MYVYKRQIASFNKIVFVSAFFLASLIFACHNSYSQSDKPNIIIFIADDVSWNDLGCYGNKDVKTPHIDALADHGIKFTNTYLTASSCSPSRNSIFTGRYPHNTGAAELHTQPPDWMVSFPEILHENGYYTAFSGKFHSHDFIRPAFDFLSITQEKIGNSGSDDWVNVLQNRPKGQPFFMWFASLDAHRAWGPNQFSGTHHPDSITPPYYLAQGTKTRIDLAQYYDEVYRFDYRIGEVIEVLKSQEALENTIIIVMSDNGRPFPHSKTRVNDRGMKTPFIFNWPEKLQKKGLTCSGLVSVIDIAPTLLSIAGCEIPPSFQGYSFEHLIENPDKTFRNYVFAEHNWHDFEAHERMVRTGDYMYILNSRPNLPNLGPADAIESPAFHELDSLRNAGMLSAIQSDIFIIPRPVEELYHYPDDSLQVVNIASHLDHQQELIKLRAILKQWMLDTGDDIPDDLTKSWFYYEPGYQKTKDFEIRGTMPGNSHDATKINNKSYF